MEENVNRSLFAFIKNSPTAWHACACAAAALEGAGFEELEERAAWRLRPGGRYFVRRNGSALLAFSLPEDFGGFLMWAAHTDSPCFLVKGEAPAAGMYTRLSVEKYGGMLCASWMDRPLSLAGRVTVREGEGLRTRLIDLDRDLLLIPSVAIHMDRTVNDGKKLDVNVDMLPLLGSELAERRLARLTAEAAAVSEEDVVSSELLVYSRTPGTIWGADGEYISAPRLDDLQCVFAGLQGLLTAKPGTNAPLLCLFDNEEVGSGTRQGADSDFLASVLERICGSLGRDLRQTLAASFMVSADNAHAVHPNHPEYADRGDRPRMNGGVVIKRNANRKYATDAISAAVFEELCARAGIPVQRYSNRPDLPGGSTLGNISGSHVSVPTVDIGHTQLAMHSAYETAGAADTETMIRAARAYFESAYSEKDGKIRL